jgi:hypothetical protein
MERIQKKTRYVHASRLSPADTLDASDSDAMLKGNAKLIFQVLSEITERAKLGLDFQNLNALIELAGMVKHLKVRGALPTRKSTLVAVLEAINEPLRMHNANIGRTQSTVASEMNAADVQFI